MMRKLIILFTVLSAFTFAQNYSLDFDGSNDYIQLPSDFIPNGEFTIEFWVKPQYTNSGGLIFDASKGNKYFWIAIYNNQIKFFFEDSQDRDMQFTVNHTFNNNQWYVLDYKTGLRSKKDTNYIIKID